MNPSCRTEQAAHASAEIAHIGPDIEDRHSGFNQSFQRGSYLRFKRRAIAKSQPLGIVGFKIQVIDLYADFGLD